MGKSNTAPLSEGAKTVLKALKENGTMTLAEMKEKGFNANSSHFTALENRGLIKSVKVTKEVPVMTKRTVNEYTFVADLTEDSE